MVWMRRVKDDSSPEIEISPRAAAIEEAELDVTCEAIEHLDGDREKLLALVRDYVALRECRRGIELPLPTTELREAIEGLAYFAAWRAAEVARGRYDPILLRQADPFLKELEVEDPIIRLEPEVRGIGLPELHLSNYLFYQGACQARLLHALDPQALAAAWRNGALLWRALSRVSGYEMLPAGERERLKQEAMARWDCADQEATLREIQRQGEAEQWRAALSARQGEGVVLRVRVQFLSGSSGGSRTISSWRFTPVYAFSSDGFAIACNQPCLVRSLLAGEEAWMELQTVLPREGFLTLRRDDRFTRLQAGEVVIQADQVRVVGPPSSPVIQIDCLRESNRTRVIHERESAKGSTRSAVMPFPPESCAASGKAPLAWPEVTATISGLFLNVATGQQQIRALDLLVERRMMRGPAATGSRGRARRRLPAPGSRDPARAPRFPRG